MHLQLIVILSILLLYIVLIDCHRCQCSCCLGSGCIASPLTDLVDAQQCTDTSCLAACKVRYYQCTASIGNGQATGYCLSASTTMSTPSSLISGTYTCQCKCCNGPTYQCTTSFVGWSGAYSCADGACSISCVKQYPHICVNDQYGRTEGTCIGLSASTTNAPYGRVRCGCTCYGLNGIQNYEVITTNGCSACLTACQSIQLQCHTYYTTSCMN